MIVGRHRDLVYFAFPKCASEWARKEMKLWWRNKYDKNDWSKCEIDYCHVQPSRFLKDKRIRLDGNVIAFTIVRNTFDRLASAWKYGVVEKLDYATGKTFREFIVWIYENRDRLTELPYCWMFLPMDVYFGKEVLEKLRVFQMDNMEELAAFLKDGYGICVNVDQYVNRTADKKNIDDVEKPVYDSEIIEMVKQVYSYEIEKYRYGM